MGDQDEKRTIPVETKDGRGYATSKEYKLLVQSGRGRLATEEERKDIHQGALTELTGEKVAADRGIQAQVFAKGALEAVNPLSLFGVSSENAALLWERARHGQEAASQLKQDVALAQEKHEGAYIGGAALGLLAPGAIAKGAGALSGAANVAKEGGGALGILSRGARSIDELATAPITGLAGRKGIWGGFGKLSELERAATPEAAALLAKEAGAEAQAAGLAGVAKQTARVGTEMAVFGAGQEFNRQVGEVIAERDGELDAGKLIAAAGKGALMGGALGGTLGLGGLALSGLRRGAESLAGGKGDAVEGAVRKLAGNDEKQILAIEEGAGLKNTGAAMKEGFEPLGGFGAARNAGPRASYDAMVAQTDKVASEMRGIAKEAGQLEVTAVADDILSGMNRVRAASMGEDVAPMYAKQAGNIFKRAGVVGANEAESLGQAFVDGKIQPFLRGEKNALAMQQEVEGFRKQFKRAEYDAAQELAVTKDLRKNAFDEWARENKIQGNLSSQRAEYVKSGALPENYGSIGGALHDPKVLFPKEYRDAATGAVTSRAKDLEALQAKVGQIDEIEKELVGLSALVKKPGMGGAGELVKKLKETKMSAEDLWQARIDVQHEIKSWTNQSPTALQNFRGDMESALTGGIERNLGAPSKAKWDLTKGRYRGAAAGRDLMEKNLNYVRKADETARVHGFLGGAAGAFAGNAIGGPAAGYLTSLAAGTAARQMSSILRDKAIFWRADMGRQVGSHSGVLKLLQGADETMQRRLSDALFRTEKFVDAVDGATPEGKTPKLATEMFGGTFEEQRKGMGDFINSLKDPAGRMEEYANKIAPLAAVHPAAAASMMQTAQRAMSFLSAVAPKGRASALAISPFGEIDSTNYSVLEMQRFARYAETVLDPDSIFDRVADGTLRTENVDAFKDVHKNLHNYYKQDFLQLISEEKNRAKLDKISLQRKMQLSKLFDIPWFKFASPNMRMAFQATFSAESAGSPPPKSLTGSARPGASAGSYETTLEQRGAHGTQS